MDPSEIEKLKEQLRTSSTAKFNSKLNYSTITATTSTTNEATQQTQPQQQTKQTQQTQPTNSAPEFPSNHNSEQ
jgi:hypothetical protein